MTNKRRGGQKSGAYPQMGSTPGGGIPAPNMNDVLTAMAAQLDAFSQEVRELKGLIKELGAPSSPARPVGWETTETLDVTAFRRARRHRMVLLTAAFMVPLMLLAVWGMWPARVSQPAKPPASTALVSKPKFATPAAIPDPVPAPAPLLAVSAAEPSPRPASVQPSAVAAVPKRLLPAAAAPTIHQPQFNAPEDHVRPTRTVANDQEHSGGAPILD